MTIGQMAQLNASSTKGYNTVNNAKIDNEIKSFQKMLDGEIASNQTSRRGRLNGEYTSSLALDNPTENDRHARPQGFAANSPMYKDRTIDKTSELYEKSLELENYIVKMMLSTMRNTVQKSSLGGNDSYASKMYEDMMYDELSVAMTKNAGFGLADQIYLSLK